MVDVVFQLDDVDDGTKKFELFQDNRLNITWCGSQDMYVQ